MVGICVICFFAGLLIGMVLLGLMAGVGQNNHDQEMYEMGYEAGKKKRETTDEEV